MRIAHISDLHFTHVTWNPFRLFSKRFFGTLNWVFNRKGKFCEKAAHALPPLLHELGVDLVLLGGDFTTTALKEEFLKGAAFVEKLKLPWLAIPGNHDHYTKKSFREKHYYRYFTNKQRPTLNFTLKDDQLEAHRLPNGWWVIALDTARATPLTSSRGLFSKELQARLEKVLQSLPPKEPVILFNHYPFFHHDLPHRTLERGEALEHMLKKYPQIRLYLHGHTHRHTLANLQQSHLPVVLDSGSCVQKNQETWNLIDLKDDGCTVHVYEWKEGWKKRNTETIQWM